jgi:hypothetical protein
MMADMNARLQGSSEALISDHTVTIGGRATIAPEHRYDLFNDLISKIKSTDESINPSRIGDTLALGTVLLHPFHDGNGRTARTIGMIFNEDFDSNDYEEVFHQVTEPRDEARKRGGFRINGYVPYIPEGLDQSNPNDVSQYFDKLLTDSSSQLYTSPYGQAELQTSAT